MTKLLVERLKSFLGSMAGNIVFGMVRGKVKMRPYNIKLWMTVKASKKTLTRMLKQAEEQVLGKGGMVLGILDKIGILSSPISIDDINVNMKQLKPGKYEVTIMLAVKAENKELLEQTIKAAEEKIMELPGFMILRILGVQKDSVKVGGYGIKVE